MARRRGGGGAGGAGSGNGGGRRDGGSRSPSGQQLSAAERRLEAMIRKYTDKFTALASGVDN
eukprot:10345113-Lingulodinium_polyedra.AAC.1